MWKTLTVLCIVCFCFVNGRDILNKDADYSKEVQEGVSALQVLAKKNLEGVVALKEAIAGGDLEQAKKAYTKSRPEYEQIEVLAGSFVDVDSDIDARAYAFDNGEAVEGVGDPVERGAHFQGFHRIEALIFRNKDLKAALRFAEDLIKDSEALIEALNDPNNFSAAGSFSGMIGLSTEVGAKKMSSEEETYSDLSILIFHNNYLGVESQYRPFASIVKDKDPKLAADMDAALSAWLAAIAPFAEEGENGSFTYTPYSKVTVSQRRDIQAGAYQVAKLLQKSADALGIVFPEEEENDEACEDTPEVVFPGDSDEIAAGLDYFRALMPFQEALAENLLAAIKGGKLAKAKEAYVKSRPLYEQIEVLAASFPQEDSDLDARPYAFGLGEFDPEFKGFHKLERQIYRDEDLGEGTIETAEGLIASLKALTKKLDTPELFGSVENFEGIIGLATEVPAKKISSEEETFSLLSHLIYYNNWKGIYSQIKSFVDAVEDKEKFSGLEEAFAKAFTCLPVETEDVWKKVSAEDVTQDFVDALTNADYKEYDLTDLEARECIIINGYKIRDLVLELSQELKVFANCHPFHSSSVFSYRHSVF